MSKRVLIPAGSHTVRAEEILLNAGLEIVHGVGAADATRIFAEADDTAGEFRRLGHAALDRELGGVHAVQAVGLGGHIPVGAREMDAAPLLEVIFIGAAGFDAIDVDAATSRGIAVVTAPGGNATGVAEHALGLMLALSHKIARADRFAHARARQMLRPEIRGDRPAMSVLEGRTLGLAGFGQVGRHLARRALAMDMTVLAYDPFLPAGAIEDAGARAVPALGDLLQQADHLSLHLPLTDSTANLLSTAEFAAMKPTASLINTSRGGIVDTDALVAALRAGEIGGAGLDVTEPEPLPDGHPLFELDTVVLTPHIAGGAPEMIERSAVSAARAAADLLTGGAARQLVNPEVLPVWRGRRGNAARPT